MLLSKNQTFFRFLLTAFRVRKRLSFRNVGASYKVQRYVLIWIERVQQAGGTGLDGGEEDDPGESHSTGSFCKVAFLEYRKTHT